MPQSTDAERTCRERAPLGSIKQQRVFSPSSITHKNNGKIRAQLDRENALVRVSGGGKGPVVEPSPFRKPLSYKGSVLPPLCRDVAAAILRPNLVQQNRPIHQLNSNQGSCSKPSTFRANRGNRMYIITARRMISGFVLK